MSNYNEDSFVEALKFLLCFRDLDLTIDSNRDREGLSFFTLFNRLDAANCVMPKVRCNNLVSLNADITVPNAYQPLYEDDARTTIIPIEQIQAVSFTVNRSCIGCFIQELKRRYNRCGEYFSENNDLLNALINFRCNAFNTVYEFGINSMDLSNKPIVGNIIAYNSQVLWVRSSEKCKRSTFYLIPLDSIAFVRQK